MKKCDVIATKLFKTKWFRVCKNCNRTARESTESASSCNLLIRITVFILHNFTSNNVTFRSAWHPESEDPLVFGFENINALKLIFSSFEHFRNIGIWYMFRPSSISPLNDCLVTLHNCRFIVYNHNLDTNFVLIDIYFLRLQTTTNTFLWLLCFGPVR